MGPRSLPLIGKKFRVWGIGRNGVEFTEGERAELIDINNAAILEPLKNRARRAKVRHVQKGEANDQVAPILEFERDLGDFD